MGASCPWIFFVGQAVRPAAHHYPAPLAVQPQLPVAAFAGVRLTFVLARHRLVKGVTSASLPDLGSKPPFDPLPPRRCASCFACGPAQTPVWAFAGVRLTLS